MEYPKITLMGKMIGKKYLPEGSTPNDVKIKPPMVITATNNKNKNFSIVSS
jgi:hypothetical protein